MPKPKEKLTPKIPPHHQYCPICGDKAEMTEFLRLGNCEEAIAHKHCNKCGATWKVKYYLKPKAIIDINVCCEYEDIQL